MKGTARFQNGASFPTLGVIRIGGPCDPQAQVCQRKAGRARGATKGVCSLCIHLFHPFPLQGGCPGSRRRSGPRSWSEMFERRLSVMYLLYLWQILHG